MVDGPDEATTSALAEVDDPRLRVVELASRSGPGGARNAGVAESRGEWVAFLDDDDLWHPRKLEVVILMARVAAEAGYPLVVRAAEHRRAVRLERLALTR